MFAKKIMLTLAAIALTGSAFAQSVETTEALPNQTMLVKTRAQVREEMLQAQKDGTFPLNRSDALAEQPTQPFVSTKTRAQVKQELKDAIADDSMRQFDGNAVDYPAQRSFVSTRTRADVRKEAVLARNTAHAPNEELYRGN